MLTAIKAEVNVRLIASIMKSSQLCYCVHPAEQSVAAGFFNKANDPAKVQQAPMSLDTLELDNFLKQVEKRAFRMAHLATSNVDDAMDIVQDAMMILASKYARRNKAEWPPLFHRILQNKIRDWHRRQKVRNIFQNLFTSRNDEDNETGDDPIQMIADASIHDPVRIISGEKDMKSLEKTLASLPLRQQQTFLLRAWEGLDVSQTAEVMGISTGSVKTHYSRALDTIKTRMNEAGYE